MGIVKISGLHKIAYLGVSFGLTIHTETRKTMNTENTPGMCVLTNHMRDLVTAENEWVSQSCN